MFLTFLAVATGVVTFTQTTVNAKLRTHVGSPYLSSLISFVVGTVVLGALCLVMEGSLLPTVHQVAATDWWMYLGGVLGVIAMTCYILLFPVIGGVQTVALPMLGQIIMSILIDNFGWFGATVRTLNLWNSWGVGVLIIGVVMVVLLPSYLAPKGAIAGKGFAMGKLPYQIMAVGAGMILGIQIAINGSLGAMLQSPLHSAFITMTVGMVILVAVNMVLKSWKLIPDFTEKKAPWWIWTGGIAGAIYVFLSTYLAPKIGTGSVVILALVGQMIASLCVDYFGLLGAAKRRIYPIQILGLFLMVPAVAAIKLI